MAHVISDECVSCGSCEGECPVGAISLRSMRSCMSDRRYLSRVIIENRRVITRRRDTVCGKLPAAVSLFCQID